MNPRLAIISFPGNNCETESLRAGKRNGFDAEIVLWNEGDKLSEFDAYFLTGGFTYEDRGRSGAIAAREPLFDILREEAQKGKIVLGVCNGAQMIVESGLIPVGDDPVPFALADNVRRDESGEVLGTGFYNEWIYVTPQRRDTAFTLGVDRPLRLPMAHGEGRFTTMDSSAQKALQSGTHVAFRYSDAKGNVAESFPITPNGSLYATAMIVNQEGTIGAIMPHPERFFEEFDGDLIFTSMREWILHKKQTPVKIGDFYARTHTTPPIFVHRPRCFIFEKKLIITDNEAFSLSKAASKIIGQPALLGKTILFEICISQDIKDLDILATGLVFNENKEVLIDQHHGENKYGVMLYEDDEALHLEKKLQKELGGDISLRILKCWDLGGLSEEDTQKILQNGLLSNPHSSELLRI